MLRFRRKNWWEGLFYLCVPVLVRRKIGVHDGWRRRGHRRSGQYGSTDTSRPTHCAKSTQAIVNDARWPHIVAPCIPVMIMSTLDWPVLQPWYNSFRDNLSSSPTLSPYTSSNLIQSKPISQITTDHPRLFLCVHGWTGPNGQVQIDAIASGSISRQSEQVQRTAWGPTFEIVPDLTYLLQFNHSHVWSELIFSYCLQLV